MARAKVNQDINLDEYQDIWVIGEQREGKLHPVTLELIGEGRKLADEAGKKLYVAVPGYDIDAVSYTHLRGLSCRYGSSDGKVDHAQGRGDSALPEGAGKRRVAAD